MSLFCGYTHHHSPLEINSVFTPQMSSVPMKPLLPFPSSMPQKEFMPMRKEYEVLSSLAYSHLHTQRKDAQTISWLTLKPFLWKLQAVTSRLDFTMKKERKWLVRQFSESAPGRKKDFLNFMKCEKPTDTSHATHKLQQCNVVWGGLDRRTVFLGKQCCNKSHSVTAGKKFS